MTLLEYALKVRPIIEKAVQSLTDNDALDAVTMFPEWESGIYLEKGFRVRYGGILYIVLLSHTSQDTWTPDVSPSLFAKVLIPDEEEIYDWEQPDSTNPYMKGNKVKHNNKVWVSDIDNNVWEPGVYGWSEVAT